MKTVFLKNLFKRNYMRIYSLFHPIEKKVTFISFSGLQYSADPRAISEKLHILYPEYKIVWMLHANIKKQTDIPEYVKVVNNVYEYLRAVATSCAFVTTTGIKPDINKRKGQFFIQTWHGDRGFKKCLYENTEHKKDYNIVDNKVTDICVAGSDFGVDFYRKAFKYEGEILREGMPKNERLLLDDEGEISNLRQKLGIPDQCRILTYAPTFRDTCTQCQPTVIDIEQTLCALEETWNEPWICLIRAHAASKGIVAEVDNRRIFDVSSVSDMADVLLVSDMLITDYSSCAGDYILCKKPVVLAVFDKDEYERESRSLKMPIEETGFYIAYNQDELNNLIKNTTEEEYAHRCEAVMEYYGTAESGKASEIICHRIDDAYKKYILNK